MEKVQEKTFRKMATLRKIDDIQKVADTDKDLAIIGGWNIIVDSGKYKAGDKVIFCEADSWIPYDLVPDFQKEPEEFDGIKGGRVKTSEFHGHLNQGLILPTTLLEKSDKHFELGDDVTNFLGIKKWVSEDELEIYKNANKVKEALPGIEREPLNEFIPKTDQERIQNLTEQLLAWRAADLTWEVSEKIDGSSMTVYFRDGTFGVCSRNQDLPEAKGNAYWAAALDLKLREKMTKLGRNIALQGELCGGKFQGNRYQLKKNEFFLFDIFDIDKQAYLASKERQALAKELGVKHCPVLETYVLAKDETPQSLLAKAEADSALLAGVIREGIVFKCNEEQISFKCISNAYLLEKEEALQKSAKEKEAKKAPKEKKEVKEEN